MPDFFIPVLLGVLFVTLLLSLAFRGSKKQDSGFQFFYFKLSYRRKMIRTLYTLPLLFLAVFILSNAPAVSRQELVFFSVFLVIVFAAQIGYNYFMWKKKENGVS